MLEIPLRIYIEAEGLVRYDPDHSDLNTYRDVRPFIPLPIVSKLRVARAQRPSMSEKTSIENSSPWQTSCTKDGTFV